MIYFYQEICYPSLFLLHVVRCDLYFFLLLAILSGMIIVRGEAMFIKILTKTYGTEKHYYASLVENKRINGKVVQTVKANLGPVTEEQIPYLKAAYSKKKPRLVYED